jgi:murein DD-endopeptidase MepM/ murein hydrolase activator NlpD
MQFRTTRQSPTARPFASTSGLSRRSFLLTGSAAVGLPLLGVRLPALAEADGPPQSRAFGFPDPDLTSKITRDITFPVEGDVSWTDTFGACRDGCSRYHEGQDLMGTKLQHLIACRDGVIVALDHESSGNSLYLQDDDGWYYAYLHINNDDPGTDDGANPIRWAFAPGVQQGSRVYRGQFIAYLGDSGNAESVGAHCHFEIRKPTSQGVWHSQAINPKYSLQSAKPPPPKVPPETFTPWDNAEDFVVQQYADFFGGPPDDHSLDYYTTVLNAGAHNPDWLIQVLLQADGCQTQAGAVARLNNAFFGRYPDTSGFAYWLRSVRGGRRLSEVAQHFATSSEFVHTFGNLTNEQFVDTVYLNVLGRRADSGGKAYWLGRLDDGSLGRGRLMIDFSESNENRTRLRIPINVVLIYALMVGRIPARDEVSQAVMSIATQTTTHQDLIRSLRLSDDYAARF